MQCHAPRAPELRMFDLLSLSKLQNGHTNLYYFIIIYISTEQSFFRNPCDRERQLERWHLCFRCEAFRYPYYFVKFDLHQKTIARGLDRSYTHVFYEFLALIPIPIRFL